MDVVYYLGLACLWLMSGVDTLLLMKLTTRRRYIVAWGMVRLIPLVMVTLYGVAR